MVYKFFYTNIYIHIVHIVLKLKINRKQLLKQHSQLEHPTSNHKLCMLLFFEFEPYASQFTRIETYFPCLQLYKKDMIYLSRLTCTFMSYNRAWSILIVSLKLFFTSVFYFDIATLNTCCCRWHSTYFTH